jgi:hypothetical protein
MGSYIKKSLAHNGVKDFPFGERAQGQSIAEKIKMQTAEKSGRDAQVYRILCRYYFSQ